MASADPNTEEVTLVSKRISMSLCLDLFSIKERRCCTESGIEAEHALLPSLQHGATLHVVERL